jgi:hypothetical protein
MVGIFISSCNRTGKIQEESITLKLPTNTPSVSAPVMTFTPLPTQIEATPLPIPSMFKSVLMPGK